MPKVDEPFILRVHLFYVHHFGYLFSPIFCVIIVEKLAVTFRWRMCFFLSVEINNYGHLSVN